MIAKITIFFLQGFVRNQPDWIIRGLRKLDGQTGFQKKLQNAIFLKISKFPFNG